MKFPLLLAQGAEGIAVGLATKILPHNFCELIEASIKALRGKKFELMPDFQTGGYLDASLYQDGKRGGKVRVRANIEEQDKKTLVIKSVPYGVTTTQLMESIVKANDQGKIKIKNVSLCAENNKYKVSLQANGKRIFCGHYEDIELADLVAQEARHKYHGIYARGTQ
jgi:DNA gyrase/topoisomerase IV subunit A